MSSPTINLQLRTFADPAGESLEMTLLPSQYLGTLYYLPFILLQYYGHHSSLEEIAYLLFHPMCDKVW